MHLFSIRLLPALSLVVFLSGCQLVRQSALDHVTGMLVGSSGSSAFLSDDDPALVREALPFALKTFESLLAASPDNRELRVATAAGFVQFANGFLALEAEHLEEQDWEAAEHLRGRVQRLSLRGRDYALEGLERRHPGFRDLLHEDPAQALALLQEEDVPLVFWAGSGWAAAIAADTQDMGLVADLPSVEALMRRGLELDEDFDRGAFHEFFVLLEGGRSKMMGGDAGRAMEHFERAMELSKGERLSAHLALASTVAVRQQDAALFAKHIERVLEADPDAHPDRRLLTILTQQRATRLWERRAELFLELEEE